MEYQTSTTPFALSGELGAGGRISRKHVYDGVFSSGKARKSGAMVEDYAEIFAGSGGSSIPFLDVPELKERKISGEVAAARGSGVDYSKVFGGFKEAEYAVSHEELFAKHKKSKSFSSREAGGPNEEARFRAPGPYHSNLSKEKQTPISKASFQSFNEVKQFNTLYNRVNPTNENGTNGTTHIAHLHAIPGYTCLIDENRPSQIRESSMPACSAVNDAHNVDVNKNLKDVNKEMKESKPVRKVVSGPQPGVTSELTCRGPAEFQKKSGQNRSFSNDMKFDAFEVGIGLHKSRMPPMPNSPCHGGNENIASGASMNPSSAVSGIDASEGGSGNYSPPFYEEIDANSAAAASVAAVRKAIEEAQAKIEIAKELMGRKKAGLQSSIKRSTANGWKAQNRELQNSERANGSKDKEAKGMCEEEDNPGKNFTSHVALNRSSVTLDIQDEIKSYTSKKVAGAIPHREARSTPEDNSLEESEDWQEVVVGETATLCSESKSTDAGGSLSEEAEDWHETVAGETSVLYSELNATEEDSSLLEEAEDWHETVGATCYSDESKLTTDNGLLEEAEDWHDTVVGETPRPFSESNSTEADNILEEAEDWQETIVRETHMLYCESKSTEADSNMEEAEDWKEIEEFFDPSVTGKNGDISLHFMQDENPTQVVPCGDETECLENMISGEELMKPKDSGMKLVFQEAPKQGNIEEKLNSVEGPFKFDIYRNKTISVMDIHHEGIDEENIKLTYVQNETHETPKASCEHEKYESGLRKLQKQGPTEVQMQELEENKVMKEAEAQNWIDTGKKQWEELNQKEVENRRDEALVREDKESRLNEIHQKEENGKVHQESWGRVDCEKLEENWKQEENKKRPDVHRREQNKENPNEVDKEEVKLVSYDDSMVRAENGETDRNEELKDAKEYHMMLEVECRMNETENRQENTCRWAETEKMQSNIHQRAEDESNPGATQEALSQENNFEVVDEDLSQVATDEACQNVEFQRAKENVDITILVERTIEVSEVPFLSEETGEQSNVHGEDNILEEQENYENGGLDQDFIKFNGIEKQTEAIAEAFCMVDSGMSSGEIAMSGNGASLGETDSTLVNEQYKCNGAENKTSYDQKKSTEKVDFELDQNDEVDSESEVASVNERDWEAFASNQEEGWSGNEIESHNDAETHVEEVDDAEMHVEEEVAFEQKQKDHEFKESKAATNHAEDGISLESADAEKMVDNVIEGKGMTPEISQDKTGQNKDKKVENHYETLKMKMENEVTLQKKDEVEKRESRKMEEAKKREMEQEKVRLVVERAIREARERAFVEARERAERAAAERAAAETHQRLKVEAQEKLEKTSSDSNDKLAAEKALREAKLRAERAAVERATAEARERALEKVMSDKTAFQARNQAENFPGDKFSGVSKDDRINYNDQLHKDFGLSSSRYPSSSNHGGRSSGAESESAQIYKARMEMHQRTAERAAKALAEKNKRDLLAQKEQAERNRLAETLDAEVKRWSSGKERNVRALLSTLQYILGPDSGWQPVPLTELISATAVKKAYRKATLCVHPDKLQQRGASIQQKYTCEKVFDLLKEAWNKFSSEEK